MAFTPPVVFEDEPDPLGVLQGRTAPTSRTPLSAANLNTSIRDLASYTDTTVAAIPADAAAGTASLRRIGTTATTAAAGNDSRLSDSRAPRGTAGGDLSGTYPNPSIAAGAIVNADVNAAAAIAESKLSLASDAAAGTASRRTLGTSATSAAAGNRGLPAGGTSGQVLAKTSSTDYAVGWVAPSGGGGGAVDSVNGQTGAVVLDAADVGAVATDDARLTDSRTPGGTAGGHLTGTYPSPTIKASVIAATQIDSTLKPSGSATNSTEALRRLGTGSGEAAPGTDAVARVAHGATAGTARPTGYAIVIWIGSVEPTNRASGDLWVRTA